MARLPHGKMMMETGMRLDCTYFVSLITNILELIRLKFFNIVVEDALLMLFQLLSTINLSLIFFG